MREILLETGVVRLGERELDPEGAARFAELRRRITARPRACAHVLLEPKPVVREDAVGIAFQPRLRKQRVQPLRDGSDAAHLGRGIGGNVEGEGVAEPFGRRHVREQERLDAYRKRRKSVAPPLVQ